MPGESRLLSIVVAVLACVGVATLAGSTFGRGPVMLVMAGFALLLAIWLLWQSTQSLTGDARLSLEEALGLGAPSAEEERKQAVLRVLKDLEYERAVGKIEEQDFQELRAKYRADAKALLATLDEELGPARQRAEQMLTDRLEEEAEARKKRKKRKKLREARERESGAEARDDGTGDDDTGPDGEETANHEPAPEEREQGEPPSPSDEQPDASEETNTGGNVDATGGDSEAPEGDGPDERVQASADIGESEKA